MKALLILIGVLALPMRVSAGPDEAAVPPVERLIKRFNGEEIEYLGRQYDKTRFKTCDGSFEPIGNGKVMRSVDRCPEKSPPLLAFVTGTGIATISADGSFISVVNAKEMKRFFVSPSDSVVSRFGKLLRDGSLKINYSAYVWNTRDASPTGLLVTGRLARIEMKEPVQASTP